MQQLISDICKIGPSESAVKREIWCKVSGPKCPKLCGYSVGEFDKHCFDSRALDPNYASRSRVYNEPLTEQEGIDEISKIVKRIKADC